MKTSLRIASLVAIILAAALVNGCGNAQSREARYVQHGQQYFNDGKYDKARVEFSNAAQIDPKDPNVRYLLGQVAEKLGDLRGAVGQYQAALAQDPKQEAARAALARIYLFAGLPAKTLELVEPGLAIDPKNAQLLTARGAARAQLGDPKAAMQDAQTALQLAPADEYAVALLSSLYRRSSQLDQAISVVQTGLQHLPKSVDLRVILSDLEIAQHQPAAAEAQLKQVIALQPQAVLNRYRLARFYLQQQHNADAAARTLSDAVAAFPDSVDAKLQLVSFLYQQRGHEQAIAQAEQFTAHEPNNDTLQLTMGQFLLRSGQSDQAAKDFRAVIAHAGTDPAGLMARDRLAALSFAKRDMTGAQALIAQVLDKNPHDADALVMRGNMALAGDDTANAIVDLRAVLRDQPNNGAVMRLLAQAYRQNGESDLAEETLRSAVQVGPKDTASRLDLASTLISTGKSDQAQPLLEQLAKEDANNLQVLQLLFQAQFAQKQTAQAGATAQTIERLDPKHGLGYYLQGLTEEADQPEVAEKQYEQALALEPTAGEPLMALVRLDLRRKQPEAALARLADLMAKSPSNPIAHDLQGDVLMTQGKTAAAIAAYQAAVQVAPGWPQAYRSLAAAQVLAKQSDEALRTLQQGVQKTQANKVLLTDLSGLYVRAGRPDDAIALYQDMLSKNPHSLFAANNLAMLLVTYRHDTASLTRAEQLSEQLASLSVPTVIDTRGWVKFKSGDFHGAESLLQQAVDKAPNAPELRYHLAMAQLRSGEPQAAQQNLQSALQSAQPFAGMDDARATLAQLHKGAASG